MPTPLVSNILTQIALSVKKYLLLHRISALEFSRLQITLLFLLLRKDRPCLRALNSRWHNWLPVKLRCSVAPTAVVKATCLDGHRVDRRRRNWPSYLRRRRARWSHQALPKPRHTLWSRCRPTKALLLPHRQQRQRNRIRRSRPTKTLLRLAAPSSACSLPCRRTPSVTENFSPTWACRLFPSALFKLHTCHSSARRTWTTLAICCTTFSKWVACLYCGRNSPSNLCPSLNRSNRSGSLCWLVLLCLPLTMPYERQHT